MKIECPLWGFLFIIDIMRYMNLNESGKVKLEEKVKRIKEICNISSTKIDQLGEGALSILRNIQKKREQKKIKDLNKILKGN
jgi:hypothetical protein